MSPQPRRPSASPGRKSQTRIERRRAAISRRRAFAARTVRLEASRQRRRKLIRLAAVSLAVLVVAAGVTFVLVQRANAPQHYSLTSEVVSDSPGPATVANPPGAYEIIYRSESTSSDGTTTTTMDTTVQRPFNGRTVSKADAPPGTAEQWRAMSQVGLYSYTAAGSAAEVSHTLPRVALGDMRLDATLKDLVADGTFVARERRRVLGRDCQVYRTGQPLDSATTAKPTSTDYSDACIDASGLLLEELTVASGKLSQRMLATSVNVTLQPPASTFSITGTPISLADGGAELKNLDAAKAPVAGYWSLPTPKGYTHQGRYQLTEPGDNPTPGATTVPGAPPSTKVSYVDVYVSGPNTVIVQQGPTTSEPESTASNGPAATVGKLGSVQVSPGPTGTDIAAYPQTAQSWFVHVSATLPRSATEQIAATMTSS